MLEDESFALFTILFFPFVFPFLLFFFFFGQFSPIHSERYIKTTK